jgi:hypothetical protein
MKFSFGIPASPYRRAGRDFLMNNPGLKYKNSSWNWI